LHRVRHRHRDERGAGGATIPSLQPGRPVDDPAVRGHRIGPGHHTAVRPDVGRRGERQEPAWCRLYLYHHPARRSEGEEDMTKILVVEDNEVNQRILVRRLERRGFEVVTASDGKQGVALAGSEAPDLILMDMSLPVLDGWEATRQIKAGPATGQIPVIALTAHAMVGDREQALDAGCDDYDVKPVDIDRLLGKIETQLA